MNKLAQELNETIKKANPHVYDMLSNKGKNLYFPKGILSQGAEAKEKASTYNATIGIATENGIPMHLPSIMSFINLPPQQSLNYAPSFGISQLREAWQQLLFHKNPSLSGKTISLPIVTNAITHGLSVTTDMWINEGDVVLLPDKIWGNYTLILTVLHDAHIKQYNLFSPQGGFNLNGFQSTLQEEAKIKEKIVVLLNFPNNPTGYTPTKQEGERIVEVLYNLAENGTNVLVLLDDAYFGLFYDDQSMKESLFALLTGIHERIMAIKLDGGTKENYVWGLRVGFITYGTRLKSTAENSYDALERKTAGAVRGSISNSSHLSQSILLGSLTSKNYEQEKEEKFTLMRNRANRVKEVLANKKYDEAWDVYPFNSGYFMCLRVKNVHAEKLRLHLLNTYGVGVISLGETDIRIAFSCVEIEDIQDLFDLIFQAIKDLSG